MEGFVFWFTIVCCVIGFIGSTIMTNKIAKETGNDLSGGFFKKLVMVIGCVGIILLVGSISSSGEVGGHIVEAILLGIFLILASLAILYFINKSATTPASAILLSVFQILYGMLVLVLITIKILGHFLGMEFGQGAQKRQAQYTKKQIDDKITREDKVAPDFATPEQKDSKARAEGHESYDELEKKASMDVED